MNKVDILLYLLSLEEIVSVFSSLVWYWLSVCHIYPLLCLGTLLLFLISSKFLSWKDVGFVKDFFYIYWDDLVGFVLVLFMFWEKWISTCSRLKLDPCLFPCTKTQFKNLNIRPEIFKFL
jgi:hypothetical protein